MTLNPQQNTIILFVKLPKLGQVKTRLAQDIGLFQACQVYRTLMRQTISRLKKIHLCRTLIAITPNHTQWYTWLSLRHRIHQGSGHLGQRIIRCLKKYARPNVIIIGSDTLNLTQQHITHTFKLLRRYRFVFGPSHDGGYWCIGWRRGVWPTHTLHNVRWSTHHTLKDSVKTIPQHIPISYTITLQDVDYSTDL